MSCAGSVQRAKLLPSSRAQRKVERSSTTQVISTPKKSQTNKQTQQPKICRFAHLTNYSINKKSKHFCAPTEDNNSDMEGSKWSLSALWRYLGHAEGDKRVKSVQDQVEALIVKTLIAAEGEIAPQIHRHIKFPGSCYELFGFDVFLDSVLKVSGERSERQRVRSD